MKKFIYLIIIFLNVIFVNSTNAQNYKTDVENTITTYLNTFSNGDLEESIEYIYPALFEFVPKEMMIESMETTFSDSTLVFRFTNTEFQKISEKIIYKDEKFVLVDYTCNMLIQVNDSSSFMFDLMSEVMKIQHGKENVSVNEDDKKIDVKIISQMFAIQNKEEENNWKIIENKTDMKKIIKKIIPGKIRKKLK